MTTPNHSQVSTLSLFGYLITVLSWEFELGLVVLQVFAPQQPGFMAILLLLIISGSMTVFSLTQGKRDFGRLRTTRGRIELSGFQAVLIAVFMIAFGGTIGLIAMSIGRQ